MLTIRTKAIIFDMDGVITNTMPDHFCAWQKILAREGIHATHLDVYRREGQPGINSVLEIFEEKDRPISRTRAREILAKKERIFKKIVRPRFISGTRRFLRRLHNQGFRLALVTGTSRHELHRILPEHIYRLFEVIVTGNDVRNGKPHPEPFLLGLRRLRIKAKDAVVIENAPFGIESAKRAHIRCFAVETSLARRYLSKADRIFSSIKDLQDKVEFVKISL